MSALDIQIGGGHYRQGGIQPVQYIEANKLAFLEGCVVKRVTRHDKPTGKGRQDIEKAIHELQLLLELRYPLEPDRADLGDFGQQNMHDFDEDRVDRVASSHGDGEHYDAIGSDNSKLCTFCGAKAADGIFLIHLPGCNAKEPKGF